MSAPERPDREGPPGSPEAARPSRAGLVFAQADGATRARMADFAERAMGFGSYEIDGNRATWSPGFRELLGLTPDEPVDIDRFFACVHPEDRSRLTAQFGRVMSGTEQPVTDFRIVRPDGTVRHVRGIRTPPRGEDGSPRPVLGVVFDVTAERLATMRAEALDARHRETQHAADVGSHVYDIETGTHEWSSDFYRILGVSEDTPPTTELVVSRIHPDDRGRHHDWGSRVFAGERAEPLVVRLADADDRHIELRCRRVLGPEGREQVMGVVIDVTARTALETQLRQAAALEAVGTLAAGVAHDFNNQLTVMSLELTRLEGLPGCPSVEGLRHALARSADLTRQLLALAKKPQGARRTVDVVGLGRRVADILARVSDPSITVGFRSDETHALVRAEEVQIEGAIMNLAFNARDAMPAGGALDIVVTKT
ncbi:MAG TPA: PAS domain-containing protein, partial [Polyangiaceae bacterium]|nr:PAS domain-containing protein [Polyangiaceae bacterium]